MQTGEQKWLDRTYALINRTIEDFFPGGIAYEVPCEFETGRCSQDMLSFKGYVHRWMTVVTQLVPSTRDIILPVLRTSTAAAIKQCTGGASGRVCGFYWTNGTFIDPAVDKTSGAGEAMNVLAAVQSLLVVEPPTTNATGGTSQGDPNAGMNPSPFKEPTIITTGDRAGAGILTIVVLVSAVAIWAWMSVGYSEIEWVEEKGKEKEEVPPKDTELVTSKESVVPSQVLA